MFVARPMVTVHAKIAQTALPCTKQLKTELMGNSHLIPLNWHLIGSN
jgi:hypothetical protein